MYRRDSDSEKSPSRAIRPPHRYAHLRGSNVQSTVMPAFLAVQRELTDETTSLDFTQNPGKIMDDITFVRSHWWLVSEGFHYRPPTPMYRNSPPLCTIVLSMVSIKVLANWSA